MLRLDHVSKSYRVGTFGGRELAAVRDVSLEVAPGEVVSLIGESGSGKSTIGRMILRLTSVTSGSITFDGTDIAGLAGSRLRGYYGNVQGVFQDPFSCYNPIFKADRALELLRQPYFPDLDGRRWRAKLERALGGGGLDPGPGVGEEPPPPHGGPRPRGEVVETGPTGHVFDQPRHPYTRSLLASVPQLHHKWERNGHPVRQPAGEGD